MNPFVKNDNKITWKVENVEDLDENGRFSEDFVIDGLKWKIKVQTSVINTTKYLSVFLHHEKERSNWLAEVKHNFSILDKNEKVLKRTNNYYTSDLFSKTSNGWGCLKLIDWEDEVSTSDWKNDFITVKCEFSYKFYDFSEIPEIFSDAIIKIGNDEIHINKGYYCAFSKFFIEKFVKNNNTEITMNDVKTDDMLMLLASLLPDPIQITARNYNALLDLSERIEVPLLIEKCDKYFKIHQCSDLLTKIGDAEAPTTKKRKKYVSVEDNATITELIGQLKRRKEFKVLLENHSFQYLEDSTKLQIYKACTKFL